MDSCSEEDSAPLIHRIGKSIGIVKYRIGMSCPLGLCGKRNLL
jgi:hypothetical protein